MTPAEAIAHTYLNRKKIECSNLCGCYRCLAIFKPEKIVLWADATDPEDDHAGALRPDGGEHQGSTAICPFCEDASIIGSASGFSIARASLEQVGSWWQRK